MKKVLHTEELKHLFDEHVDLVLAAVALWLEGEGGVPYTHKPGTPFPGTFSRDLDDLVFSAFGDTRHQQKHPFAAVVIQTDREVKHPEDAGAVRDGKRDRKIPARYLQPDTNLPDYTTALDTERDYNA